MGIVGLQASLKSMKDRLSRSFKEKLSRVEAKESRLNKLLDQKSPKSIEDRMSRSLEEKLNRLEAKESKGI